MSRTQYVLQLGDVAFVCVPQKDQPAAVHAERGGEDPVEASVRLAFLPTRRRHQALPGGESLSWQKHFHTACLKNVSELVVGGLYAKLS